MCWRRFWIRPYYVDPNKLIFITSHLLHVIAMLTFFQAVDRKITPLN